jgi:hypothetical protein
MKKKIVNNCDNHIQLGAIIIFCEKFKTPFRINPERQALNFIHSLIFTYRSSHITLNFNSIVHSMQL